MFDLVIRGGTIIDGTGAEPYRADLAIKDGKIAAIGPALSGAKEINALGLVVSPGFIDSHSHSDNALFSYPGVKEKLEQGITTCIAGQCGTSATPSVDGEGLHRPNEYYRKLDGLAFGTHHALYVGHGAIRRAVMGNENAAPTDIQLEQMKMLLREAMENGALGLSFGLMYNPGCYSETEELVELAKVVAEYDGVISAHIRNEGDLVEEALEEFLHVLRVSGVRGVYSHHKSCGKANHGKVHKTMAMLEKAVQEGIPIWCDVYPYTASSTSLSASFVDKVHRAGTPEDMSRALEDPEVRSRLLEGIRAKWGDDLSGVLVTNCGALPEYNGMTVAQIAALRGEPDGETALELVRLSPKKNSACFFSMAQEDMEFVLSHPRTMVCTDSSVAKNLTTFHPRLRGSFPRALGVYAREKKLVSLSEMIRKMTSLPASVYRLTGKGVLREGYDADICVFDPEKICATSDYHHPKAPNEGLSFVFVEGKLAARDGEATGICAGRFLHGKKVSI